jgi:hypothetical protein
MAPLLDKPKVSPFAAEVQKDHPKAPQQVRTTQNGLF